MKPTYQTFPAGKSASRHAALLLQSEAGLAAQLVQATHNSDCLALVPATAPDHAVRRWSTAVGGTWEGAVSALRDLAQGEPGASIVLQDLWARPPEDSFELPAGAEHREIDGVHYACASVADLDAAAFLALFNAVASTRIVGALYAPGASEAAIPEPRNVSAYFVTAYAREGFLIFGLS